MKKPTVILIVAIFLAVLAFPWIYTAVGKSVTNAPSKAEITLPASGKCVKETAYMRSFHMELLYHERDAQVREGKRNDRHSLDSCASCHTSKDEFCDSCHGFVGVKLDCFQCHYYPKGKVVSNE